MAKLVRTAKETNPYNDAGVVLFAYFEGKPSKKDLQRVINREISEDMRYWAEPERKDNVLSERAGLQRWLIGDTG